MNEIKDFQKSLNEKDPVLVSYMAENQKRSYIQVASEITSMGYQNKNGKPITNSQLSNAYRTKLNIRKVKLKSKGNWWKELANKAVRVMIGKNKSQGVNKHG